MADPINKSKCERTNHKMDDSSITAMSSEEKKIRGELEAEIERELEEEIKDGIYHLALRLHRLYQHRKAKKHGTVTEVNINIKMEGETKIEIKESKKEGRPPTRSPRSENNYTTAAPVAHRPKKFDWASTLRSETVPAHGGSYRARVTSCGGRDSPRTTR